MTLKDMTLKGIRRLVPLLMSLLIGFIALLSGRVLGSPLGRYEGQFTHYATVGRPDGSFRRMLIDADSATRVEPSQALPEGTTILMETWHSAERPSTVFVKTKQNGAWLYGSFPPGRPDLNVRTNATCHSCHQPFAAVDGTLTLPLLLTALETNQPQRSFCEKPGRRPCSPEDYQPDPASPF